MAPPPTAHGILDDIESILKGESNNPEDSTRVRELNVSQPLLSTMQPIVYILNKESICAAVER